MNSEQTLSILGSQVMHSPKFITLLLNRNCYYRFVVLRNDHPNHYAFFLRLILWCCFLILLLSLQRQLITSLRITKQIKLNDLINNLQQQSSLKDIHHQTFHLSQYLMIDIEFFFLDTNFKFDISNDLFIKKPFRCSEGFLLDKA